MSEGALLDTSFFIRLLNEEDPKHQNAMEYFKYFMENDIRLVMSTIAIAEYCVKGDISDLPLRNILFRPFNINHATRAGELMQIVYEEKANRNATFQQRVVIPNDTKMFAQADCDEDITYFVSADSEAAKIYELIKNRRHLNFKFIDIRNHRYDEVFGLLNM